MSSENELTLTYCKILKRMMCTEMKHSPKGSAITQEVFIIQGINSNNRIYQLMISLYGRKYLVFYMRSRSVLELFYVRTQRLMVVGNFNMVTEILNFMTQIFDLLKDVNNFGFMFSTSCFQVYSVQCSMSTSPSQGVVSSTASVNLLQSDIRSENHNIK
jgi:hypothetical protein